MGLCCLAGLVVGCASGGREIGDDAHLADARSALRLYDRGQFRGCTEAFKDWLLAYEGRHWDRAIEVRFFMGLCYVEMGERETAREVLADLIRRYGGTPADHPAARFIAWAERELTELKPKGP
jgi:TolA-binding protein